MKIAKDSVVSFHYTASEAGTQLETSRETDPILYLHGHNGMFDGIEKMLEGQEKGAEISAELAPEDAYGHRVEGQTLRVPLKHIQGAKKKKPKVGDTVAVNTANGVSEMVVLKVGLKNVDVDANHPFAGKTLTFDLEVMDVREATAEELAHGHAHGVGGHQHD
ncbi:FKBP-type peptidyl-prolyl cis-trans isomerase [Umboniibacter marinipuniceus]|uniref:Peptidyl-prolyl cis-trans isomerase n=1 Tax=Umboniibacter marinipuniceus TaxID=569599 RepID=A0A3M0AMR1_9GAMM|nr:peptidylprolyl isomerase [Umboniibacter marinipuniceus]RMA80292.1 FKBP-type peptidyl-prolyl cis-trans isomerase SlyD [Umboniibacter marinipuniceus]